VGASPILEADTNLKLNARPADSKPKLGLRAWMERVLEQCSRADKDFDADAVHDLRVALRRCRSLADGLMALDPDSSWKAMKKAGKKIFQELGDLRDMQVMEEWIEKLSGKVGERQDAADDPVAIRLLDHIKSREAGFKQFARKDLDQFDRRQWRQWSKIQPQRAGRVRPGSLVYMHLALEKWTQAYELHRRALRTRSTIGWHELRIGIKHFRYTVENFLPLQHARWGDDLKELQDLLGDVHDLDVLWATAISADLHAFADAQSRKQWREKLSEARNERLARYREKMAGRQSLWRIWRAELPSGPQLHAAALSRLRTWAGYLDPDFAHSQRVAQMALRLYDGLQDSGVVMPASPHAGLLNPEYDPRTVLQAAALMHEVGKARGAKNHQKKSYRMIRGLERPLGWSARELELAAVVARYHRGALPRPRGKIMQRIEMPDRPLATLLAGILRVSVALNARQERNEKQRERAAKSRSQIAGKSAATKRIEVRLQDQVILLRVGGYSALDRFAEEVAAARHLLETVLRRPVLVRTLRSSTRQVEPPAERDTGDGASNRASNGANNNEKRIGESVRQPTSHNHEAA
jgi:CHAD domain-containing protein